MTMALKFFHVPTCSMRMCNFTCRFFPRSRSILNVNNSVSIVLEFEQKLCDEPISLAELTNSVKSLNLNKSPGPDGLTVEFFLHFWDLLGPPPPTGCRGLPH